MKVGPANKYFSCFLCFFSPYCSVDMVSATSLCLNFLHLVSAYRISSWIETSSVYL